MKRPLQFTIMSGLVVGAMTIGGLALASDDKPQSKSEAAAMREAIRFERAKDAADRRQLRMENCLLDLRPKRRENRTHRPAQWTI